MVFGGRKKTKGVEIEGIIECDMLGSGRRMILKIKPKLMLMVMMVQKIMRMMIEPIVQKKIWGFRGRRDEIRAHHLIR
jgi:hypothetical protein